VTQFKNFHPNDIDFLMEINREMPSDPPPKKISDYIEGRRIMPSSTPFPGFWENWRTYYAVEIMDSLAPWSPIRYVDVMSGAQVVKSATAENVIGYYMDAMPSPILYVSGSDDLLTKWGPKRLEPLIDSIGMRGKIQSFNTNKKSGATGDKMKQKLFTGGFLEMASAQSPSSLRADSVKVLILEEVDSAPPNLTTGEGRWDLVAEARTKAFENRKKILAVSTPTTFQQSIIFKRFSLGDQRQYMMPCPHCKKEQILERGVLDGAHGLRPEYEAGDLKFVYYICDHCHEAIFEHHKNWMIPRGRWEPATKGEQLRRSYQISSLYSAVGMYSWLSYWKDYEAAQHTPDGMRSFTNLQDGLPFKESGTRPKLENVIELRGGYRSGQVHDDVLYITVGVDVQQGSKNDPKNPPRLELEILGIGAKYRTWSINYLRFEGPIDDPFDGAWEDLNDWALSGGLSFRKINGKSISAAMVFIDSGDGNFMDVVYKFAGRWKNTFPVKGFNALKKRKGEKGDEFGPSNFKRFRTIKVDADRPLYEISTNYYKSSIYNNLKVQRQPIGEQKAGFCDFPIDYGEKYFKMLVAEERKSDGSFHCPSGRRNEALDVRVYALCASDVFLDAMLQEYRVVAKSKGASAMQIQSLTHRTMIEILGKQK
jgi:phage terminase large subunit GpA-like protein